MKSWSLLWSCHQPLVLRAIGPTVQPLPCAWGHKFRSCAHRTVPGSCGSFPLRVFSAKLNESDSSVGSTYHPDCISWSGHEKQPGMGGLYNNKLLVVGITGRTFTRSNCTSPSAFGRMELVLFTDSFQCHCLHKTQVASDKLLYQSSRGASNNPEGVSSFSAISKNIRWGSSGVDIQNWSQGSAWSIQEHKMRVRSVVVTIYIFVNSKFANLVGRLIHGFSAWSHSRNLSSSWQSLVDAGVQSSNICFQENTLISFPVCLSGGKTWKNSTPPLQGHMSSIRHQVPTLSPILAWGRDCIHIHKTTKTKTYLV